MEPMILHINALPLTEVRPGIHGATWHTNGLSVTLYRYAPRSTWEVHEHAEEQVTVVLGPGQIQFDLAGRSVQLRTGETAVIPGGIRHAAEAGDEEVVTVNVFVPSRQDDRRRVN